MKKMHSDLKVRQIRAKPWYLSHFKFIPQYLQVFLSPMSLYLLLLIKLPILALCTLPIYPMTPAAFFLQ